MDPVVGAVGCSVGIVNPDPVAMDCKFNAVLFPNITSPYPFPPDPVKNVCDDSTLKFVDATEEFVAVIDKYELDAINEFCTFKLPVTANEPVIRADPVNGNPTPEPPAFNANDAVVANDADVATPVNDPLKDPVATMVSVDPPLNASIARVTCSA
jgi:hypothetical protein